MRCGYISIIGRPNSGKSTLLNNILKEDLSIVTAKAQTTRKNITGIHNVENAQLIFLDTPGYHESEKELNIYMMEQVNTAIKEADVICLVIDASKRDHSDIEQIIKHLKDKNVIIAINKIDTIMAEPWDKVVIRYKEIFPGAEIVAVSAKTGFNVEGIISRIVTLLPESEPMFPTDIYTNHPMRFLAAETIREQVFLFLHQEIPYSTTVVVDQYKEEEKIHRIHASIIVEKDSQKAMVIGKGGLMLKKIGTASRLKLEKTAQCKVFLKLFVKVDKNWTKDAKLIREFV